MLSVYLGCRLGMVVVGLVCLSVMLVLLKFFRNVLIVGVFFVWLMWSELSGWRNLLLWSVVFDVLVSGWMLGLL